MDALRFSLAASMRTLAGIEVTAANQPSTAQFSKIPKEQT